MRKVSVGSENPVKIAAVENVIKKIWPDAKVVSVEVPHGASEQPTSDDEAIQGATNRAKLSMQETDADLGIGLEGSTVDTKYGMFLSGWVVAMDKSGQVGMGCGGRLPLPERIAAEIKKGKELGPMMDELVGEHNTKQKQGAVGILTGNLVPRTAAFENAVIYALTRFVNPDYYRQPPHNIRLTGRSSEDGYKNRRDVSHNVRSAGATLSSASVGSRRGLPRPNLRTHRSEDE
jgi:inosine/xanthosine triphosphatase